MDLIWKAAGTRLCLNYAGCKAAFDLSESLEYNGYALTMRDVKIGIKQRYESG